VPNACIRWLAVRASGVGRRWVACGDMWVKLGEMLSLEARPPETIHAAPPRRARRARLRAVTIALLGWARFTAMMIVGMLAVWVLVLLFG
jgi:hypothetical protein